MSASILSKGAEKKRAGKSSTAFDAETELLLLCARFPCEPNDTNRIKELIDDGVDWERLIQSAERHKVSSFLYLGISKLSSESIPASVLHRLRDQFLANSKQNLLLSSKLIKLLDLLQSHSIQAMPLKGPLLSAWLYGDVALRQISDLDLLIHRRDVREARALLELHGFKPQFELNHQQELMFLKLRNEYIFLHPADGVCVDLHWALTPKPLSLYPEFESLWEKPQPVMLWEREFYTLNAEATLLFLCVHGAKHIWYQLSWIADVAAIIRTNPGMNWGTIISQAESYNCERMLYLGLNLAHDLFAAELPEDVLKKIKSQPLIDSLTLKVRGMLSGDGDGVTFSAREYFYLRTFDRAQQRAHYLLDEVFSPTPFEWKLFPLPVRLHFLYYFIRPARLACKQVKGRFKQLSF